MLSAATARGEWSDWHTARTGYMIRDLTPAVQSLLDDRVPFLLTHRDRPRHDARGPTERDGRGRSQRRTRAQRAIALVVAQSESVAQSENLGGTVAGEGRVGRAAEAGRPATRRPRIAAVLAVRGGADGDRVGAHLGAVRTESTPRGCAREHRAAPAVRRSSAGRRAAAVPLGRSAPPGHVRFGRRKAAAGSDRDDSEASHVRSHRSPRVRVIHRGPVQRALAGTHLSTRWPTRATCYGSSNAPHRNKHPRDPDSIA